MGHQGLDLTEAHSLLDRLLHSDEANAELVLEELADRADPAVAEVIDSSPQETILQLNYDIIKVHISLGIALQRLSSNEKAIAHFQEALRIEPDNALAHNNLSISLANLGRFQDAMESFQQAVQIKPDYKQARDNLRRVEAHLQRNDDSPEP